MILVGELINATRKVIKQAVEDEDKNVIQNIAIKQYEAGVDYIDVNAGGFVGKEAEYLKWLVSVIQDVVDCPCAIDSPDPKAIEAGLSVHKGPSMINSISLETESYESLIPIVANTDFKVVALCMSDEGMPETAEDRLRIADKLINGLTKNNIPLDNIFVDPLVQSISVNQRFGYEFYTALDLIGSEFAGVHFMCGLSNISYGLPARKYINRTFMAMAISHGLDGAIIDPLDTRIMVNIITAEALAGKDEYCRNLVQTYRAGKISF